MKKIEDMTAKELMKLADEKWEQEMKNSVEYSGYLKHDLYDYDPEEGYIDLCGCIGESKETIDKSIASALKNATRALPRCITICAKKGTIFYKREGYWNIGDNEKVFGELHNVDLTDSWAKKNLIITKVYKMSKKNNGVQKVKNVKKSSMLCDHANEVPAVCKCPSDCYCKDHTCKEKK